MSQATFPDVMRVFAIHIARATRDNLRLTWDPL